MSLRLLGLVLALAALAAAPVGAAEEAGPGGEELPLAPEEEPAEGDESEFEDLPAEYAVAYVNGEPVAHSEVRAASEDYAKALARRARDAAAGTWTSTDEAAFEDGRLRALGQVVARRLILQEAQRGLLVHLVRRFGDQTLREIFGDLVDENASVYALSRMRITLGMYRRYDQDFNRRFEEAIRRHGGPVGLWDKKRLTPEQYRRRFFEQSVVGEYLQRVLLLDASPAPREVRAYYQRHRSRFQQGESVQARLLTIRWNVKDARTGRQRDRAAARELAGRLREEAAADPARFGALVRAHSDDALTRDADGRMGPGGSGTLSRGTYLKAIEDAAFATPAGEVSRVVETDDGFHAILVEAHRPAGVRPLAEVEREIRKEVGREKHARQVMEVVERLYGRSAVVDADGRRLRYEALFGPRPERPAATRRP